MCGIARVAHDARFGSVSALRLSAGRAPYAHCMEINNWPPYSSFDDLSGGSIMFIWSWLVAFGRQWRRPRLPASRSIQRHFKIWTPPNEVWRIAFNLIDKFYYWILFNFKEFNYYLVVSKECVAVHDKVIEKGAEVRPIPG